MIISESHHHHHQVVAVPVPLVPPSLPPVHYHHEHFDHDDDHHHHLEHEHEYEHEHELISHTDTVVHHIAPQPPVESIPPPIQPQLPHLPPPSPPRMTPPQEVEPVEQPMQMQEEETKGQVKQGQIRRFRPPFRPAQLNGPRRRGPSNGRSFRQGNPISLNEALLAAESSEECPPGPLFEVVDTEPEKLIYLP